MRPIVALGRRIWFLVSIFWSCTTLRCRCSPITIVTHVGTHQDFYVRDFRPKPFMPQTHAANPQLSANKFHHQHRHGFPFNQPALPAIVYLITSLDANHEPHWSPSPVCLPNSVSRQPLARHFTTKIGWYAIFLGLTKWTDLGWYRKTGFLNYVQLHAEDFDGTWCLEVEVFLSHLDRRTSPAPAKSTPAPGAFAHAPPSSNLLLEGSKSLSQLNHDVFLSTVNLFYRLNICSSC
jgi:hypothetical protein